MNSLESDHLSIPYWTITTNYQEDITDYLEENEINATRHNIKGVVVYVMTDPEDYGVLNTFLSLMN